ncbi:cob(I)yrinic acid a,c-diamide adenosyltransferase [Xenorhabdus ishibashii]|uniref:Corrinoid adenosyltransferase n=1 Tax=Xenorhabdus ishibashii TaxID=1034471 RepID=A0A2D0KA10_9GAMM|nr:cob(I)yrinic acid a,c-diamide adenosyltransferase [Xenorhabdus ishibashii]PHM60294.1 cobalamin adenolsyltransferase/cobinamide ATP-dependent adenolsyltransferase [Xenorhabdus ishibashii]
MTRDNSQYQKRQQRLKEKVDARIEAAQQERGVVIVFTGNGKGKTTAAFGTVIRAIGHGQRAGVIQFIKGTWESGERNLLIQQGVEFHVMATGFTWETQNRESDTAASQTAWKHAVAMLSDPSLHLVVLDELTYMVSYGYLELTDVLTALKQRPAHQSVIITGRGCHRELLEYADTITEMRPVKHAFNAGIKAQKGIDW